jgi:hypothetical protein
VGQGGESPSRFGVHAKCRFEEIGLGKPQRGKALTMSLPFLSKPISTG